MFEKASRLKLRFDTPKGLLCTEDLWDLPLTSTRNGANLNDIAKALNRELKASGEEDFVHPTEVVNTVQQLKFDVVKHIIATRLGENEQAKAAADKKAKKERLLEIIARKQDEQLQGAPLEELQKMVADL